MAVNRIFGATSLSNGTAGSLKSISSGIIKDGDICFAVDNSLDSIHFYTFVSTSSAAESIPKVVQPNDSSGNGRWIIVSPQYFVENMNLESSNSFTANKIYGGGSADVQIGYSSSSIDITIDDTTVSIYKGIYTDSQITSDVTTGTAPFVVASTSMVANLNAELHGGQPVTNVSLLNNNTNKYSVIPKVTDANTVVPSADVDLVTVKYYNDNLPSLAGGDHGSFTGLSDDDHQQYILADGTRLFTDPPGVTDVVADAPTANYHLTTKKYVDDEIYDKATSVHILKDGSNDFTGRPSLTPAAESITPTTYDLVTKNYVDGVAGVTDHGALNGLADDDHEQYVLVTGDRVGVGFTSTISGVYPTVDAHLATKEYVDDAVGGVSVDHGNLTGLSDDDHQQYILADGSRSFTNPVSGVDPVSALQLTTKQYVDGLDNWEIWTSGDLSHNKRYFVDTSGSSVVLDLSATPSIGDTVVVDDYQKNSSVNNITIRANAGGTLLVEGVSSNIIVDVDGARVIMTYVDGTYGWRYKVI